METKKETVQCNQCGVYVNSAHLARHRQAAICDQKVRSNAQMQMQNAERERLADTLKEKPESPFLRTQSALHNLLEIWNFSESFQWIQASELWICLRDYRHNHRFPLNRFFIPRESEQEQPVTPKAGLNPHASFSNLIFGLEDAHKTCANDQELSPSPSPRPVNFILVVSIQEMTQTPSTTSKWECKQ